MVSRLLIGDNNLSRFWPAYQFSRPGLKSAVLITATDLDALDHALSQSEDKNVVIISVLTSILIEEVNQLEVEGSAQNVCDQAITRLLGMCPQSPSTQVWVALFQFFVHIHSAGKESNSGLSSGFLVLSGAAGERTPFSFFPFFLSVLSGTAREVPSPSLVPQLIRLDLSGLGQAGPEVPSELAPPAFLPHRFHHVRIW